MSRVSNILYLFLSLSILAGSAASNVLLNGTDIYLATGDSYALFQGYILSLKSVTSDSAWLQLAEDDIIVKSDVTAKGGYFIYSKNNTTILSVKVNNIYSGSSEQNLVYLFPVYQFADPAKPLPDTTEIQPRATFIPDSDFPVRIEAPGEPVVWVLGIVLTLILFYILRKLW